LTTAEKYKQVQKDLKYIEDNYGEVYDFCGAFCNCDAFRKLLANPTKQTAVDILKLKLESYYSSGYSEYMNDRNKLPIENDEILQEIKERWNI
jgi:hypothetical protein